ncbi:MAG TPA: hypothetical protein VIZ28_11545, partial [Chitinophagaceae bacterium]
PPVPPAPPMPPAPPEPVDLPSHVKSIDVNNGKATIILKDGTKEKYDLKIPEQKKVFESKYGVLPTAPTAPTPPAAPIKSIGLLKTDGVDNLAVLCEDFEITAKKAVMHLKNGTTEEYDLTNINERRQFEKKYGKIINVSSAEAGVASPVAVVNTGSGYTTIAPMTPMPVAGASVMAIDPTGNIITGEEDVLVVITKKTTRQQLDEFIKQMKEKGIELKFDNVDYNDGILVSISGTMKSKDGNSNFSASDFKKLTLAVIRSGDRTYFKVSTADNKVVI